MLTGKPPFQSTSQEEIYRKARAREYDWPKLNTTNNYIGQETKDLVADLLQSPEERPNPDDIVQHPFFTSGYIPLVQEMLTSYRDAPPTQAHFYEPLRGAKIKSSARNLMQLEIACDVGKYATSKKTPATTYREVADEEKAGLTPAVPLPDDVVYRPFAEVKREHGFGVEMIKSDPVQTVVARSVDNAVRSVAPSFAAQQRAQPHLALPIGSTRASRSRAPPRTGQDLEKNAVAAAIPVVATSLVAAKERGLLSLLPSKSTGTAKRGEGPSDHKEVEPTKKHSVRRMQARVGAVMVEEMMKPEPVSIPEVEVTQTPTIRVLSMIGPREAMTPLANTKPDVILSGLRHLKGQLEEALSKTSTVARPKAPATTPTVVVKWVDYTNKFGLGYILNNGSVGCIFKTDAKDSGSQPSACVVVRDAETHLQNRENKAYVDRHQLVPISGQEIEFYENRGADGIVRAKVNPREYRVSVNRATGEVSKLARGRDEYDDRKREKIVLWKKFANYMTAFGRDNETVPEATQKTAVQESESVAAGHVVTFYQRFGDVGCWTFGDGHFQFNFPDHTKLVLSADGTWCDFYHLSIESAHDLARTGVLPPSALDGRQNLSHPVQTLLNFQSSSPSIASASAGSTRLRTGSTRRTSPMVDPMLQGIPAANHFRSKIEFIVKVMAEWVERGGLGNSRMDVEGRLRWMGPREREGVKVPYKHVWVTVGARSGDQRRVAWFDPKRPGDLVEDLE